MDLIHPGIAQYCAENSTHPSDFCAAIHDYTTRHFEDSQMLVGPWEAGFLGLLVEMTNAERVLEIGCYTGYSALAMAERLPEGGRLFTIDHDRQKAKIARSFWDRSPHGQKIEFLPGTAADVARGLDGPFDLVFIDADKKNYRLYLDMALPKLSERGLIVADNTLWYGTVLDSAVDDPEDIGIREFNRYVRNRLDLAVSVIPLRDGVSLIRRRKTR